MESAKRIPRRAVKVQIPDTTKERPNRRRRTDFSGALSLQSICRYYGVGPAEEWEYTIDLRDLGMDTRTGPNPSHLEAAAAMYRLRSKRYLPMSNRQLRDELDARHPVLMMIQAWGKPGRRYRASYKNIWSHRHWVVAVGYDQFGVFFEDPYLQAVRGWLSYDELGERWHGKGRRGRHVTRYGLALWKRRQLQSGYARAAWPIG